MHTIKYIECSITSQHWMLSGRIIFYLFIYVTLNIVEVYISVLLLLLCRRIRRTLRGQAVSQGLRSYCRNSWRGSTCRKRWLSSYEKGNYKIPFYYLSRSVNNPGQTNVSQLPLKKNLEQFHVSISFDLFFNPDVHFFYFVQNRKNDSLSVEIRW